MGPVPVDPTTSISTHGHGLEAQHLTTRLTSCTSSQNQKNRAGESSRRHGEAAAPLGRPFLAPSRGGADVLAWLQHCTSSDPLPGTLRDVVVKTSSDSDTDSHCPCPSSSGFFFLLTSYDADACARRGSTGSRARTKAAGTTSSVDRSTTSPMPAPRTSGSPRRRTPSRHKVVAMLKL